VRGRIAGAAVISLSSVTRQHGHRVLFVDASFQLDPGEKVGLVGANGSGKTTLFRMIVGEESADEGSVERPKRLSIGYFRQDADSVDPDRTVVQEAMAGDAEVAALTAELAQLERRMEAAGDDFDAVVERFGEAQARFTDLGGWDLESRAAEVLAGLGFAPEVISGPATALSGGWRMRLQLAKILVQRPDVMLLDEPTNHLDLESILWLEEFLRGFQGSVLMTCHDRDVLDRVVSRIAEIDGGTIRSYTGNYAFYERMRAEDATRREAEYDKQQAMLAKELRFIERFKAQPRKASQVQSRAKKVDKIERVEPPPRLVERKFEFRKCARSGDDVIVGAGLRKSYGQRHVLTGLDVTVRRGERWAVMGENGAGKSTLLKLLAGASAPDGGAVRIGANVGLGYYAQHQAEQLDLDRTVIEELQAHAPTANLGTLRNLAGAFGFSGDDVDKPIFVLSGGEKARLVLAKLLYDAPNLLVLDEPTNHLDLVTKRALVKALGEYEGTLVFVSHDRTFLRSLATRVLEVGREPRVYLGPYDEYVAATGREAPGMRVG
jgi:ATPase subunit of ABC transporter with duplicated ATPase domains